MGTLYENILALCQERGIKGGKMCTDIGMSKGILTDLKMGRQTSISTANAQKIASYFNVSVDYLLGEETEKPSTPESEQPIKNPDIRMIARAGEKMTAEQAENLRKYAQFMFPEAFEE